VKLLDQRTDQQGRFFGGAWERGWTIAHFTRPTDGASKGSVREDFLGRDRIGSSITRDDIADYLLSQVDGQRFIRAAPAIII
jgi:hypothetical protein